MQIKLDVLNRVPSCVKLRTAPKPNWEASHAKVSSFLSSWWTNSFEDLRNDQDCSMASCCSFPPDANCSYRWVICVVGPTSLTNLAGISGSNWSCLDKTWALTHSSEVVHCIHFILHGLNTFLVHSVTQVSYLRFHEHALPFLQWQSSFLKTFQNFPRVS